MDGDVIQNLLDKLAQRDEVIARQAAEIVVLKQTIDALCRKIFGASSEKIAPAQLEFMLGGDLAKKASAADPANPGPAAEIPTHKKAAKKTRAPRINREIQYEHWRALYRQIDETPIRHLQPGSGKAQTGYLWTSNIPGGTVFYHWHDGRDAKGMTGLFEKTEAPEAEEPIDPKLLPLLRIIQCDGYTVYPSWAKDRAWIKLMGCHSHVRRNFLKPPTSPPRLVGRILRQLAHLYQIEKRLRETKAGPALRQAVRAAESRMIHRRLKKAIAQLALRSSILPKSKLGKAISYAVNQWPNLETYLGDGRVEICNNLTYAERGISEIMPPPDLCRVAA